MLVLVGWAAALGAIGSSAATPTAVAHGAIQGRLGRKFAKYMYQHRYQWMVNDLRKAGLNPILATGTTPGGVNAPQAPGGIPSSAGMAAGAKELAKLSEELKMLTAQRKTAEHQEKIWGAKSEAAPTIQEIIKDIAEGVRKVWSTGKDITEDPEKVLMKLSPILDPAASGKDVKRVDPLHAPGESGSSGGTYYYRRER